MTDDDVVLGLDELAGRLAEHVLRHHKKGEWDEFCQACRVEWSARLVEWPCRPARQALRARELWTARLRERTS